MLSASREWLNSVQVTGQSLAVLRLGYGPEGADDYIPLASGKGVKLDGIQYRGLVASVPDARGGFDIRTHKIKTGSMRLKIHNGQYFPGKRFSDLLEDPSLGVGDDMGFYNRWCEIRLWVPGMTAWADCLEYRKGKTRDISHDDRYVYLDLEDEADVIDRSWPTDSIHLAEFPNASGESLGKRKPWIMGDRRYYRGSGTKSTETVSLVNQTPPAVYLGLNPSTSRHEWLISDHQMDSVDRILAYDDRLKRDVELVSFTVDQNTTDGCIISHPATPTYEDIHYGSGAATTQTSVTDVSKVVGFNNLSRVNDQAFSLYSRGEIKGLAQNTDWIQVTVPFGDWGEEAYSDTEIDLIQTYIYGKGNPSDTNWFTLKVDNDGAFEDQAHLMESGSYPDTRLTAQWGAPGTLANASRDVLIRVTKDSNAGETITFDIYEVYKGVRYRPGRVLPVKAAGRGVEYGTWINGRTGHADNNQTGAMIENPAGCIEALARLGLDRVDGDLDLAAFNQVSQDRSAWKMAPAVITEKRAKEDLGDVGRESQSFLWFGLDGTLTIKALPDYPTAADLTLDWRRINPGKPTRTNLKHLYTAVEALYRWDGSTYWGKTTKSTISASQSRYNLTANESTLTLKLRHVGHQATAEAIRDMVAAQWRHIHNVLPFRVGLWGMRLTAGDVVAFEHVPLKIFGEDVTVENTRNGQLITPYWLIVEERRDLKGADYVAFQLHDLR